MTYTPAQLKVLNVISEHQSALKVSPTYKEIAGKLRVSVVTVFEHINQLERKGAIKRERCVSRSLEIIDPSFLKKDANVQKLEAIQKIAESKGYADILEILGVSTNATV